MLKMRFTLDKTVERLNLGSHQNAQTEIYFGQDSGTPQSETYSGDDILMGSAISNLIAPS